MLDIAKRHTCIYAPQKVEFQIVPLNYKTGPTDAIFGDRTTLGPSLEAFGESVHGYLPE